MSIVANIDHPKVICHCNILILHNFSTLCTCLLQCISRKVLKINVFQTVAYWWCGGPLQILWCMEINLLHKIQLEKKNKLFFFSLSLCCHSWVHFCFHWEVKPPDKDSVCAVLNSTGIMNHRTEKRGYFLPQNSLSHPVSLYTQGGPLPHHRALLSGLKHLQGYYLWGTNTGATSCAV